MDRINQGELTAQETAAISTAAAAPPANIPQMKLDKLGRHRLESFADSQKTPAQRVKHKLTTIETKGDPRYPKVKYHPHKSHIVVKSAEDETDRAPAEHGWVDSVDEFPPSAVRQYSNDEKLAMFDHMAQVLGIADGENPVEALMAFRDEFNDLARKYASSTEGVDESLQKLVDAGKKKGK